MDLKLSNIPPEILIFLTETHFGDPYEVPLPSHEVPPPPYEVPPGANLTDSYGFFVRQWVINSLTRILLPQLNFIKHLPYICSSSLYPKVPET